MGSGHLRGHARHNDAAPAGGIVLGRRRRASGAGEPSRLPRADAQNARGGVSGELPDLVPTVHGGFPTEHRAVVVEEAVAGAVVTVELVRLAGVFELGLVLVDLRGRGVLVLVAEAAEQRRGEPRGQCDRRDRPLASAPPAPRPRPIARRRRRPGYRARGRRGARGGAWAARAAAPPRRRSARARRSGAPAISRRGSRQCCPATERAQLRTARRTGSLRCGGGAAAPRGSRRDRPR